MLEKPETIVTWQDMLKLLEWVKANRSPWLAEDINAHADDIPMGDIRVWLNVCDDVLCCGHLMLELRKN